MKNLKFLLVAMLFIAFGTTKAQTVALPDWGPTGYDNARYYYLPDIETYYDVRTKNYVYMDNGKWARTTTLPTAYKDYDLYDSYKVVLTDDKEPFDEFDALRAKYAKGYKGDKQQTIKVKKNKIKIKDK
jgi:hypothetical protein